MTAEKRFLSFQLKASEVLCIQIEPSQTLCVRSQKLPTVFQTKSQSATFAKMTLCFLVQVPSQLWLIQLVDALNG